MCFLISLFGLAHFGTVDRVEGALLVIEWSPESFSEVPAWLLPDAQEGDRICLAGMVRPHLPKE